MEGFVEPLRPVSFDRLSRLIVQAAVEHRKRRRQRVRTVMISAITFVLAAGLLAALTTIVTMPV